MTPKSLRKLADDLEIAGEYFRRFAAVHPGLDLDQRIAVNRLSARARRLIRDLSYAPLQLNLPDADPREVERHR